VKLSEAGCLLIDKVENKMKQSNSNNRVVMGIIIIGIGVLALVDKVLTNVNLLQFWPVVFMVLGIMKITQTEHRNGYIIGGMFIALGCLMTLQNLGWIHFRLRDWWPLLLIGGGVWMLLKGQENGQGNSQDKGDARDDKSAATFEAPEKLEKALSTDSIDCFGIMAGNKVNVTSQAFRGGEATAVMGGVEIDCSKASIQQAARLHVFSVWGGIEISVPADWTVINNVIPIMGGVDDKTVPPLTKDKCLVLEGFVLMAGVEVKNR
jgi:predicted membrane protein